MGERVLILYRPALPSLRAQCIGVLQASHALARRGHAVTLLADRAHPEASPADALALLGLAPISTLDLRLAPGHHQGGHGAAPFGHQNVVSPAGRCGIHRLHANAPIDQAAHGPDAVGG